MKEFEQLTAGTRVVVARRAGIVYGLKFEEQQRYVFVQYDDGFSQWVPIEYVQLEQRTTAQEVTRG